MLKGMAGLLMNAPWIREGQHLLYNVVKIYLGLNIYLILTNITFVIFSLCKNYFFIFSPYNYFLFYFCAPYKICI
jgi:hypothetical protein